MAAANAADNLLALCKARDGWSYRHEDYVIADAGNRGCRAVVARPPGQADAAISRMIEFAAEYLPGRELVVEDTFGTLPLEQHGFIPFARVPVMVRGAGVQRAPQSAAASAGVRVTAAKSTADVDTVERLMVDGLPLSSLQPWRPGVLFPPDPANIPGWIMWLALADGAPAGCCGTFDDGHSAGLYGMAVDPALRRHGIGRAMLDVILDYYSGRTSCLTATPDGFWLYAAAGYRTVGQGSWWRREPG